MSYILSLLRGAWAYIAIALAALAGALALMVKAKDRRLARQSQELSAQQSYIDTAQRVTHDDPVGDRQEALDYLKERKSK